MARKPIQIQAIPTQKYRKVLESYELSFLIKEAQQEGSDGRHNDEETDQDEGRGDEDYRLKPPPDLNTHDQSLRPTSEEAGAI